MSRFPEQWGDPRARRCGAERADFDGFGVEDAGAIDREVKASVKWFNATKGFGFVAPMDGSADAFLHISVLSRTGYPTLGNGAEVLCQIGRGPKGPLVTRILEVFDAGAEASSATDPSERGGIYRGGFDRYGLDGGGGDRGGPEGGGFEPAGGADEAELLGTVKWFKPDKGFGFIIADDASKDIFIHKSVLRRCGVLDLEPGQRVLMRVQNAPKGREATWIDLL